MQSPPTGFADLISANLSGSLAASKVIDEIRRGVANPDATAHAIAGLVGINDTIDRAMLRGFCRTIQKMLEAMPT